MALEDMYDKLPKFIRGFRIRADPDRYWLDHFEKRREGPVGDGAADCWSKEGGTVYISQPYRIGGLEMEELERLIVECKDHDISFDIQPTSDHFPGSTIMFRWYPEKDKEKYRRIYMHKRQVKKGLSDD
jgi:hypothetical protein